MGGVTLFDRQQGSDGAKTTDAYVFTPPDFEVGRMVDQMLRARARRTRYFGGDLFGEPAWDMLLSLYSARCSHQRISVSAACVVAGVPATTGLRWVQKLVDEGLICRRDDPLDQRREWVELTPEANRILEEYVRALTSPATGEMQTL